MSETKKEKEKEKKAKEKERKEKEKEKRDQEKERREQERKKEREEKEKEREGKEQREKEEKEQREKEEKERKEREREEKEKKKERREREKREREGRPSPAVDSDEDSIDEILQGSHGFAWRMLHTVAHMFFICLLLLTIGSLGMGVSSLFAKSVLEVSQHWSRGISKTSFMDLCLALLGLIFFLVIMALTLLTALMLVPALWVSFIEIIVCPWSIISDYFLP